MADIRHVLPEEICLDISEAIHYFAGQIEGDQDPIGVSLASVLPAIYAWTLCEAGGANCYQTVIKYSKLCNGTFRTIRCNLRGFVVNCK